jgi:predicted AAA+ superfamily ATPase
MENGQKQMNLYPRFVYPRLLEALEDSPAVLIHGPRQCGKTTLARQLAEETGCAYITFDDDLQLNAAKFDPIGFVADLPERVVLDEVQRVPELFTSLKFAIDEQYRPGRFILTGSANVLLLPNLADSLAGRMEIFRLCPLSQAELSRKRPVFLECLFQSGFKTGIFAQRQGKALAGRLVGGGFPAALARPNQRRREAWYRNYADTLLQRDIRDLLRVSSLELLSRLLTFAAGHTACLLNVAAIAAPFHVSRQTVGEYLALFARIFLLEELAPWHNNLMKRLVKSPKLHFVDSGLACTLLGLDEDALWSNRNLFGQMLETFVYQELRRQASWYEKNVSFTHFRDRDQIEVDIILESHGQTAAVEVKAASTVSSADFKGLRKLKETLQDRFVAGVVLYDGEAIVGFGERLYAIPITFMWDDGQDNSDAAGE